MSHELDDGPTLTDCFRSYRECARTVWNLFLMPYPDAEGDFDGISSALCEAMVLSQLEHYQPISSLGEAQYYPGLRVVPPGRKSKLDALCATKNPNYTSWEHCEWTADLGDLRFASLFDFETFSGTFRDFRYAECVVVRSNSEEIVVGQRVLIDAVDICMSDASQLTSNEEETSANQ